LAPLILLVTAVFLVIGLAVDFRAAKITGGGYADSTNPLTIALAHRKREVFSLAEHSH